MRMTIPFDSVRDVPLETDSDIVHRLRFVLDGAIRRQVWLMFLDDDDHQLPVLYPSYLPPRPRQRDVTALGHFIAVLRDEVDAHSVIITYERRGGVALSVPDRAWLRCLRDSGLASGMPFRGPYLLHSDGVLALPPDDYAT